MSWDRCFPRLSPIQFRDDVLTCLKENGWPLAPLTLRDCELCFRDYLTAHYFREDENLDEFGRIRIDFPNGEYIRSASARVMIFARVNTVFDKPNIGPYREQFLSFDPYFLEAAAIVEWSGDVDEYAERVIEAGRARRAEADRVAHLFSNSNGTG